MSNLRDFTPERDDSAPRFVDSTINEPIRDDVVIVDDGGLGDFHIDNEAEESGARRSKLLAGIAVAAVFGLGGAFAISQYIKDQPVVADQNLPSPSAPSRTAAMPPPAASEAEATAPAAATPAPAAMTPTAPDVVRSAPVIKQTATANAPKVMATPQSSAMSTPQPAEPAITPAPVQNQAASAPDPVSPTPPISSQAGNPALNQQSAEPEQTAPAAPQAAAPEAAPAQPAEQAPAAPTQDQ